MFANQPFLDMLAQQPGMIFYKSLDHTYSAASDYTARLCGFKNAEHFAGCNDYELRCSAIESAEEFRAEDKRVIQSLAPLTCLQLHQYADNQLHIFMLKKTPVKDAQGNLLGICGFGNEITSPTIGKALFHLISAHQHWPEKAAHNLEIHDYNNQLSSRESQVLFYFMRGFSNKEIGVYMNLSPRTIETYIERIKCKFICKTRSELQAYCLQKGLIYIIPKSILGAGLNKSIAW